MAFPVAIAAAASKAKAASAIAQGVGAVSQSEAPKYATTSWNGGLVGKLGGSSGDPVGFFIDTINQRRNRETEQKRYDEQMALQKSAFAEQKLQNAIGNQQTDRDQGMSAIGLLANQRAQAMASFNNQKLKDSFYKAR